MVSVTPSTTIDPMFKGAMGTFLAADHISHRVVRCPIWAVFSYVKKAVNRDGVQHVVHPPVVVEMAVGDDC